MHDLTPEKIDAWLSNGVNRISLGVQSFDTDLRQRIGRIDSGETVLDKIAMLKSYDVTVIIDIIYGLPGQTVDMWLEDVRALENVLSLWKERGLMQEEVGVYHLTKAGEFWYVSLSQSLVECAQVIWDDGEVDSPVEEINGKTSDALAEVLSEFLLDSTAEGREKILKKMPMAVRTMLRKSSKEALKAMLASMPKAMREKMLVSSN